MCDTLQEETSIFTCGNCKYFISFRQAYEDELEDSESGYCQYNKCMNVVCLSDGCEQFIQD